ncbi:pilus assembly protein [Vibrio sp. S4M6]|uniref:TadE/TadG family type IV pilus assembly protein n=1 Tax=Vibrio sinus TaxID=2946865 RepID=UPI00202A8D1C|nr:TadE/TadG family type IV pilus assembly protein [Vibrio sinus]MCL9781417.1 pilus assembly protein [Vibrio sinus]
MQIGNRYSKGIAAVEMTLVLPVLLFIFIAITDAGRMMYASITNSSAARNAAGYGAQSSAHAVDSNGIETIALGDAVNLEIDANNTSHVDVTSRRFCRCPGSSTEVSCTANACPTTTQIYVEVTTTRDFRTIIDYPGIPDQVALTDTAEMRVQ